MLKFFRIPNIYQIKGEDTLFLIIQQKQKKGIQIHFTEGGVKKLKQKQKKMPEVQKIRILHYLFFIYFLVNFFGMIGLLQISDMGQQTNFFIYSNFFLQVLVVIGGYYYIRLQKKLKVRLIDIFINNCIDYQEVDLESVPTYLDIFNNMKFTYKASAIFFGSTVLLWMDAFF